MADNTTLPGTGVVVATDDVAGVQFQKVKLDGGGDGASAPITGDTTNGLDVDVTRQLHGVSSPVTATWTSATPDETTLELITTGYASAVVTFTSDGAGASGGEIVFDGTVNGIDWFGLRTTGAGDGHGYYFNITDVAPIVRTAVDVLAVTGLAKIRMRLSIPITGAVSLVVGAIASSAHAGGEVQHGLYNWSYLIPLSVDSSGRQQVVGVIDEGFFPNGAPVRVAGSDGFAIRTLKTDANGELQVDVLTLPPITGITGSVGVTNLVPGTGNTELGKADGAVYAVGSTGVMVLGVRQDTPTVFANVADGDYSPIHVDQVGRVHVKGADVGIVSSTVPAFGSLVCGTDTTTLRGLRVDASGELQVDVLTVPAPLSTTGGGVESTALRVTIANDSTGVVSVDDNNGSLTVDAPVQTPVFVRLSDGASAIATLPVSLASVPSHAVTNAGTFAVQAAGDVAHDTTDAGSPVKIGYKAVPHGANPTAVAAGDRTDSYANRAGIPFVMGGHPNIQTVRLQFTAAQTNTAIISASVGTKIVVTALQVTLDNASTVFPSVRIGFGTASTPTTTGVIAAHGGVPAGGGFSRGDGSGIIGVGADDEDLRITTVGAATGNGVEVIVTYYTIES